MKPICYSYVAQRQIWSYIWARVGSHEDRRVLELIFKDHPIQSSNFPSREMNAQTNIPSETELGQDLWFPKPFLPDHTVCSLCLLFPQQRDRGSQAWGFLWSQRNWALHWYLQVSAKLSQWGGQWTWGEKTMGCFLESGTDLLIFMPFLLTHPFN